MKNLTLNASIMTILALTFSATATAGDANSKPNVTSSSLKSPATTNKPAYGDNPSLGRVLLYKTGKGIQNVGDAIQRSSENTANAIKQRLNPEQQAQSTSSNTEAVANNVTPQTLTEPTAQQASQQTGPAHAKTMTQGRLSQSTTSATATNELKQTAPASNGVKTYAIGTE